MARTTQDRDEYDETGALMDNTWPRGHRAFDPQEVDTLAEYVLHMLDDLASSAPGIHEAVASRLGTRRGRYLADMHPEIVKLAEFIMEKVPGEPSRSESAVECAIRVIEEVALPILNDDEAPGSQDEVY